MIKHKPILLLLGILFLGTSLCFAQKNTVASGGDATGPGGSVSFSVGQIDYKYQTETTGNVNQGVQQPYEIFTSGVEDPAIQLGLSVYPNPSTNVLYLKIEKSDLKNLSYQLFDMNGKLLASQLITNNTTEIMMETYASSSYFLKVSNSTQELTTFKIIKK